MRPEQILEISEKHLNPHGSWSFTREGVIAFAQAIIEERESIGEPVAWIDHEGGLYHYKLYETYLPLYRHPPHKRKLTDEEIFEVVREASRGSALMRDGSTSLRIARAIERVINGEKE